MNQQLSLFDYQALDAETRIVVQQRTGEIKALVKKTVQDVIEIGEKLVEVKERLGYGHFGAWLDAEFEWTDQYARQLMNVAREFGGLENETLFRFAPSALRLLAAPSTPADARDEALARARAGEEIGYKESKDIVAEHKAAPVVTFENQPGLGIVASTVVSADQYGAGIAAVLEAKAPAPEYVSVWKLEQGIRTWLVNMQLIDPNGQLHILEAIKLKTPDGAPYLETLLTTDVLAGPRRKSDVIQAVNNLYAQKLRLRAEVGESDDDLAELEQLETEERAAAEQDAGLLGEAETQFLKVTVQDLEILPTAPTPDPNPPGSVQQSLLCYCRSCGKERWISRATHDKDLRVRCLFCYAAAEAKLWRSEPLPPEADDAQDLAELERVSPERAEAEAFLGPAPTEAPKPREAHLTLNVSVRPDGSALITAILGINPVATKATTWQRVGLDVQIIVNEHAPRPAAVEAVEPEAPEGRAGVVDT